MADNAPLKNCEKNSVSRLGSDRIEQTHELIHCRQRAPIENVWSTSGIF
jgi:hypothetical protein